MGHVATWAQGVREGGERREKEKSTAILKQPTLEGNHGMQEPWQSILHELQAIGECVLGEQNLLGPTGCLASPN
jgi:hypothetical protein